MNSVAVTGYASVDYVLSVAGQVRGDHTTLINHRSHRQWPRVGGCPAFVSIAAASAGGKVNPVSWIGDDVHAEIYMDTLASQGLETDGVARLNHPSPISVLVYQDDGSCACLYDPVFNGHERLTSTQSRIVASASHLCISVGPAHLMGKILANRNASARLYWVCKNDAECFTPEICSILSNEADVIFCSHAERELIGDVRMGTVIVETRGAEGVHIEHNRETHNITVEPLNVRDTTGAGDTLAGGYIAAEMAGETKPLEAARYGVAAVRSLLEMRAIEERQ